MPEDTINQRLRLLIKALGLNTRSFTLKYNLKEGTTRNYIDRDSTPSADYLASLINSIEGLNPAWLLVGQGEMFLSPASNTGTNHIKANSGQAIGVNHGTATYQTLADCEKDLKVAQEKIELLMEQLANKDVIIAAKDDLIAAKEEMLVLLRGSRNRPN